MSLSTPTQAQEGPCWGGGQEQPRKQFLELVLSMGTQTQLRPREQVGARQRREQESPKAKVTVPKTCWGKKSGKRPEGGCGTVTRLGQWQQQRRAQAGWEGPLQEELLLWSRQTVP